MDLDNFIPPERWVTDSFIIRSYYPGEGALLAEAVNSSYEHLRAFMPWAKPYQSVEESERVVRRARARYLQNEDFMLAIFSADERRLLGGSGLHLREGPLKNRSAEIGMWIRADAAGEGLGTSVLLALTEWAFTEWPFERLAWRCDGRNVASRRTAEKAGFEREGILRAYRRLESGARADTYCYALLRDAWRERARR